MARRATITSITGILGIAFGLQSCIKNMASNSRRQIEIWLGNLEIKGSVIDIGGLFWPVRGRTKTWDVPQYDILDVKESRKGVKADFVFDLNRKLFGKFPEYDVAFCIEVTDHFWDPVIAFQNIRLLLKTGGMLYISSNFLFPHHTGFDCIRLTRTGLEKILTETGFEVLDITPRFAVDETIEHGMRKESKVVYHPGEIGYMVTARKV